MKKNINLLPAELQKSTATKRHESWFLFLLTLMAAVVLIGFTGFYAWIEFYQYRADRLETKIAGLEPKEVQEQIIQKENQRIEEEIKELSSIQEGKINWTVFLRDLNNRLPRDMWITGFSYGQDGKVRIKGMTVDVAGVGVLIYEMHQLPYIADFSLEKASEAKAGEKSLTEFTLVGTLVKGSE